MGGGIVLVRGVVVRAGVVRGEMSVPLGDEGNGHNAHCTDMGFLNSLRAFKYDLFQWGNGHLPPDNSTPDNNNPDNNNPELGQFPPYIHIH